MDLKEVEPHHKIFFVVSIIVALIFDYLYIHFYSSQETLIGIIGSLTFFLLTMFVGVFSLTLFLYTRACTFLIFNYKTKKFLGSGDFILTNSAIITAFLMKEIGVVLNNYIADFLILVLYLIVISFVGYYLVYFIETRIIKTFIS